ncbi:Alpha/Beta hydrolase protein [Xylariaceae sp. FL0016]|nr:Alpha/Beta hydrolase protein [Xylariaceae sp. FL0016]
MPVTQLDVVKSEAASDGSRDRMEYWQLDLKGGFLTMGAMYDLLLSEDATFGTRTGQWRIFLGQRLRSFDIALTWECFIPEDEELVDSGEGAKGCAILYMQGSRDFEPQEETKSEDEHKSIPKSSQRRSQHAKFTHEYIFASAGQSVHNTKDEGIQKTASAMASLKGTEAPTTSITSLDVPGLGLISGICYNEGECTQYLGVPYAEIPGRFRRSRPAQEPWPNERWDGTKLGPYCPQPPRDFYPVPSPPPRTWLNTPGTSEFECLNLNISVPGHDVAQGPMPVLIFLHGGAFTYSTGASPIYDGRFMATSSALDNGTPTIVITMNYRLGVYGFLAGTDIQAYASAHGEDGCGNYGVWDQVIALQWVQKHISAFGGDPARVCIFGQSAGALSVACHMSRAEALFESAILSSGRLGLCGILTPEQYQVVFEKMLAECGVSLDLGPVERVEALATVPENQLTKAMIPVFIIPVITMPLCDDGVLLKDMGHEADYKSFKVPPFVKRHMMGDAVHECIIWNKSWNHLSVEELLEIMDEYLGEKSKLVAELYGIRADLSAKQVFDRLERMTTDGLYRIGNYFAELAEPSVYAYHFNVPSPYDNPWGGLAHHSLDNVLIFGVLRHTLPPAQQKLSEEMMSAWIKFANGIEPWERFSVNGRFRVWGPETSSMQMKEEYDGEAYRAWEKLDQEGLVVKLTEMSDELCLKRRALLTT